MRPKQLPDQALLIACLDYNPNTGLLIWKIRPVWTFNPSQERSLEHIAGVWNAAWSGKTALTSVAKNGYLRGTFNGAYIYAHRAIWKLVTGNEPDDIDHLDGNRQNNRFANLESKSRTGNLRNRALSRNNTSGFHGVSYSKTHKLWCASIYHLNQPIHLGWFKYKADAVTARQQAEQQYGYHQNHGRSF